MPRPAFTKTLSALAIMCATAPQVSAGHHTNHGPDIVDTAVEAGSFETLVTALKAADLVDTLKGSGPFTVFAPTDEAFAKLPSGTVESLLEPSNRDALRAVLTFHVVEGRVPAAVASSRPSAKTVNGQRVALAVENGRLRVGQATVETADLNVSNGVIHVIDTVLLPASDDIVGLAKKAGTFETLLAAATAAGLADTLTSDGPFTIFAPTDEAFADLPEGTVESLLAEEGLGTLKQILTYHVIEGRVYSSDALAAARAATIGGERVEIGVAEGRLRVNEAAVVANDLDASNGVVHVIDRVLLPPAIKNAAADRPVEMTTDASAESVIRLAIQRGVPLFNQGDEAGCAAVYEIASTSLLNGGYDLPAAARRSLESGLRNANRADDARERAWALRYGLDDAWKALRQGMARGSH